MNRQANIFIDKYIHEIRNNSAAIFVGAGLSSGSGFVNWKELLRDISYELGLDVDKEHDLIGLAQYYINHHRGNRNQINQTLVNKFTKDAKPNVNHAILAELQISTFWTTNYDTLIENALELAGKRCDTKICPQNLGVSKSDCDAIVYKMHGDISLTHEAVLTKEDYECYNEKRQVYTTSLQGDLISKTFLFLGFSFDDPNLEYILSRIRILLGANTRTHYCILKRNNESEFDSKEEFEYANIKQSLKIEDLKRYNIHAILIDAYSEITEILEAIKIRSRLNKIFISGAADEYHPWDADRATSFIFNLSAALVKNGNVVISGFGLGVGSSVINGVLSYIKSERSRKIDNYLVMRPFPQNILDPTERAVMWKNYREDMISLSGIAIFIFGNKKQDGKLVLSDGMREEFMIAKSIGLKILPVGCTGYVAKEIYDEIRSSIPNFFGDNKDIPRLLSELAVDSITETELIDKIIQAIKSIQKH